MLDNTGSRVVSYLYDDFGDVTESKATGYSGFENELQYTGAVHDELTGLLYLNARYYEPRTATEARGRMQIRGICMRIVQITRSTMWIRAGTMHRLFIWVIRLIGLRKV